MKTLRKSIVVIFWVIMTMPIFGQGMYYQQHGITNPLLPEEGVILSNGDYVFCGRDYTNVFAATIFSTAGWSIPVVPDQGDSYMPYIAEYNDTIYCAFTHNEAITIGDTTYPDPPLGARRPIALMISATGDILDSWEVSGNSYVWGISARSGEFAVMGRAYAGAIEHLPPIGVYGGAYVLVNNLSGWDTEKGFSLETEYIPDMQSIQYLTNGNLALSGETAGGDISFGGIDLPVYGGGDGFRGEITTSGLGVHAIMIASLSYSAWEEDTYQITNPNGSFMISGIYNYGISFYQSDGTIDTTLDNGNSLNQIYFAVYNSEGVFQNASCAYNHTNEDLYNVQLACNDNAFYAIFFNKDGGTVVTPTGSHEKDAAVFLKFDSIGNPIWSKQYEGTLASNNFPKFIIDEDKVSIIGVELPTADLDFNTGVVNLSEHAGYWCEYNDGDVIPITATIELSQGWTWFSLNVEDADMSLDNVLSSLTLSENDYIKNQTASATYYEGYGWYGALTDVDPALMYQISLANSDVLEFTGMAVDLAATSINLNSGWTWIGYVPQVNMDINTALSSLSLDENDYIKNQTSSATYYAGYGWYGALETLEVSDGFKISLENADVLTYPATTMKSALQSELPIFVNNTGITIDPYKYEFNGTVTARVFNNFESSNSEDDLLLAYVGNECRGISKAMYFEPTDEFAYQLMIYSNIVEGETITFKYFDSQSNELYDCNETIQFSSDMVMANAYNALDLNTKSTLGVSNTLDYSIFNVYPNPTTGIISVDYTLKSTTNLRIVVSDIYGKQIKVIEDKVMDAGSYSASWNAKENESGTYFLKIVSDDSIQIRKIVLMK